MPNRPLALLLVSFTALVASSSEPLVLNLYGEKFDVTPVLAWHPGGAAILRQVRRVRQVDSTALFESQHALRDPEEMRRKLDAYRLNGTSSVQLYSFSERGETVFTFKVAATLNSDDVYPRRPRELRVGNFGGWANLNDQI